MLYFADSKMKADQWCKPRHSYSRKSIVAKVQHIEYNASASHYLDPHTGTQLQSDVLYVHSCISYSSYFC
jgi:hypothetical protein